MTKQKNDYNWFLEDRENKLSYLQTLQKQSWKKVTNPTLWERVKNFFKWCNTPKHFEYYQGAHDVWCYKVLGKRYCHSDRKELIKHYKENYANVCIPPRRWLDF